MMLNWLLDPRVFNYVIIVMFVFAAARWVWEKNWPQSVYWLSAACLNVAVTFMAAK
jgi:NADH:ubiquinone oxidoreductase subunit 6 (subunit J)